MVPDLLGSDITAVGKRSTWTAPSQPTAPTGTPAEGIGSRGGLRGPRQRSGFRRPGRPGQGGLRVHDAGAPTEGAVRRAEEKGAAAIFDVNCCRATSGISPIPSARLTGVLVGHDDGVAAPDLLLPAGQPARVKVSLSVDGAEPEDGARSGAPCLARPTRRSTSSRTATAGSTRPATTRAAWPRWSAWPSTTARFRRPSAAARYLRRDRRPSQLGRGFGESGNVDDRKTGSSCSRRPR